MSGFDYLEISRDITTGILSFAVNRKRQQSESSFCWRFLVVTLCDPADRRRVGINLTAGPPPPPPPRASEQGCE